MCDYGKHGFWWNAAEMSCDETEIVMGSYVSARWNPEGWWSGFSDAACQMTYNIASDNIHIGCGFQHTFPGVGVPQALSTCSDLFWEKMCSYEKWEGQWYSVQFDCHNKAPSAEAAAWIANKENSGAVYDFYAEWCSISQQNGDGMCDYGKHGFWWNAAEMSCDETEIVMGSYVGARWNPEGWWSGFSDETCQMTYNIASDRIHIGCGFQRTFPGVGVPQGRRSLEISIEKRNRLLRKELEEQNTMF